MSPSAHTSDVLPTLFLPAERAEDPGLLRQIMLIENEPLAMALLDASLGFAMVLNRHRQIVHINDAFATHLRGRGTGLTVGQRPGEAMHCIHAAETQGGCGTTEACRFCGAAQTLASGLRGHTRVSECRIQTDDAGDDLDLLVRVTPLDVRGEPFLILSALDISHEKRRQALERVFFHDITNTAGGINGLAGLIHAVPSEATARKYSPLLAAASRSLLDEIATQSQLSAAEHGELAVRPQLFRATPLLEELVALCGAHPVGQGRHVKIADDSENVLLHTDRVLLMRVLANLVKNALEAELVGSTVTLRVMRSGNDVVCEVRNPAVMPRAVQLQLFQRSFSTKGVGRGLGSYSVRLLAERYLRGSVSFESAPGVGTVLRVRCSRVLESTPM